MDNRFSTMTEVRRVGWPSWEKEQFSEQMFLQGIAGTLELFHLSIVSFQNVVGEATGQPVPVFQRIDQAGQRLPLDERVLADTDTLMVFGLDHLVTEQEAFPEEIEAIAPVPHARRNLPGSGSASRRGCFRRPQGPRRWNTRTTAILWSPASKDSASTLDLS